MLILLFPHMLPHLRRCAPEVLLEYPAKQLIIGESMAFQDHMHRVFRIDQIFVDKRKSVFILIFQKCNPHLFLEKTAEISSLEISNTCNLIQGNRPFVILRNIIQHQIQPVQIFFLPAQITLKNFDTEIVTQLEQKFKDQDIADESRMVE